MCRCHCGAVAAPVEAELDPGLAGARNPARCGSLAVRAGALYTVLDANQPQVDFVRSFGNKVYNGDATPLELLRSAGVAEAKPLVLAIDDVEASVRTAALVAWHFPQVAIYARARNCQHAFKLMDIGVRHIIGYLVVA